MAKAAFRVEDGLIPGHTNADLGHTALKFRDIHMSNDMHIDNDIHVGNDIDVTRDVNVTRNINVTNDVNVTGDLDVDGGTILQNLSALGPTVNLPNFAGGGGGGGGGGGVSEAEVIAFAIALG